MKKYFFTLSILATSLSACTPPVNDTALPQASVQPTAAPTDMPSMTPNATASPGGSAPPSQPSSTSAPTASPTVAPTATPMMTATPAASATPEATPTLNSNVPAPLNLRVTDRTGTNIFVNWTAPSTDDPALYNLYLNGERVGDNINREFYSFADLSPNTSYTLAIETVTAQGLSSRVMLSSSTGGVNAGGGGGGGGVVVQNFTQVERLARPAINEGLIRQSTPELAQLLRTWNSVPPSVDTADIAAAAEIRSEAVTVLSAIQSQVQAALAYDNTPGKPVRDTDAQAARVGQIASVFLPDVMRIDTTGPSGYAMGITDLAAPRPFRGRRIDDDVIDITLAVLVPGGALDPLDPMQPFIDRVETDNVEYDDLDENMMRIHDPIPTEFPYLAAPN